MRISSALLLLLAACDKAPESPAPTGNAAQSAVAPGDDDRIDCALHGAASFARTCTVERDPGERGLLLTIRHPDGGFRRLRVTQDGRGVVSDDGAEPAHVTLAGKDGIEVAIGEDRYRLPATVRGK